MNPYDIWIGGVVTCLRDRFGVKVERDDVEKFVEKQKFPAGDSEERVARAYYRQSPTPNWRLANSLAMELRNTSREAALIIANFEAALRSALVLMSPEQIDEFGEMDAIVSLRNARKGIDDLFQPKETEVTLNFVLPKHLDFDKVGELRDAIDAAVRGAVRNMMTRDTSLRGVSLKECPF